MHCARKSYSIFRTLAVLYYDLHPASCNTFSKINAQKFPGDCQENRQQCIQIRENPHERKLGKTPKLTLCNIRICFSIVLFPLSPAPAIIYLFIIYLFIYLIIYLCIHLIHALNHCSKRNHKSDRICLGQLGF